MLADSCAQLSASCSSLRNTGSIPRHLLHLATPLMLGNLLQQLYNTVDAFILGRFAGELEFAAVKKHALVHTPQQGRAA